MCLHMSSDKVLVTGGLGFIGSHVVDLLIEQGREVAVIDNLNCGDRNNANEKATYYETDIRDQKELKRVFEKENPTYVIHLAAQSNVPDSIKDPLADGATNILGTLNLIDLAREWKVKKFVYSSSAAVYGNPSYLPITEEHPIQPLSFYGLSKYTPEQYLRLYHELYGLSYTALRYANVYGPRQVAHGEGGVVAIFIDRLLQKEPIFIQGDGNQTRDFIYVRDVARANLLSLEKEESAVIHVSTGLQTSINQLVTHLEKHLRRAIQPEYTAPREGDIYHSYMDNSKMQTYLGWKPQFSLDEGLAETLQYEMNKRNTTAG